MEEEKQLKKVTIYTDGACSGNPGPGGYGVILKYGEKRREIFGGYRLTTNNRMELMAVIIGLRELRYPCDATVFTDSQYVAEAITQGWAQRWRENGWKRNKKEKAINPDLWDELLNLCDLHEVKFEWLKGHAGDQDNERCDRLSVKASQMKDLATDEEYEVTHSVKT